MSTTTCLHCTAETSNGLALCQLCQQTLTVSLTNTAAYYTDVDRIRPGQRVKVRSAYQSTPPPLTEPQDDKIAAILDATDNAASTWTRMLHDDRPGIGGRATSTTAALAWLEQHVPTIVTLGWAAELLRDMMACEKQLRRLLDQADTGWYAGRCGNEVGREMVDGEVLPVICERPLYGTQSSSWVSCPECGRTWDVASRRTMMMAEARDELAPVSIIARAVVGLLDDEVSVQRLANRIDQWVKRGKIHDLGVRVLDDGKPHRVYRLGDVFDLLGERVPPKSAAC